jgi:arylamine N-acetyltransferase
VIIACVASCGYLIAGLLCLVVLQVAPRTAPKRAHHIFFLTLPSRPSKVRTSFLSLSPPPPPPDL